MCRCKGKAIQPEADKSDVICRFFLFAANHNENKKEKMEHENRQWGLRLWSKTNQYSARVLNCKISFVQLKTYLAESRRIPLRLTKSEGLIAPNYNWLHSEKATVIGIADCFNYLEHQYWQNPTSCNEEEQDLMTDSGYINMRFKYMTKI